MRNLLTGVMMAFAFGVQFGPWGGAWGGAWDGVWASPAEAHEAMSGFRYDAYCCNGNNTTGDCQMIPTKNVRIVRGGYEIVIGPGDHRLITRPHDFTLPQSEARHSSDSDYHICLYPNEDTLRCFYAPDMSY